jgi:protein TonB
MDFARQQRDPTRHLVGITFVVLLHALIVYALVSGLARKAVEVNKKPIDAKIIEEIKAPPPPPPPPKPVQQQPQRVEVAPQPYIPPPDIEVPTTPQTAPTISAVTTEAPTQPYVIAPPPPVAVARRRLRPSPRCGAGSRACPARTRSIRARRSRRASPRGTSSCGCRSTKRATSSTSSS